MNLIIPSLYCLKKKLYCQLVYHLLFDYLILIHGLYFPHTNPFFKAVLCHSYNFLTNKTSLVSSPFILSKPVSSIYHHYSYPHLGIHKLILFFQFLKKFFSSSKSWLTKFLKTIFLQKFFVSGLKTTVNTFTKPRIIDDSISSNETLSQFI